MSARIEALILYAIIFLPGALKRPDSQVSFSSVTELIRIFFFTIPASALIMYLFGRRKHFKVLGLLPCKKDFFTGLLMFPCLIIIGFFAGFAGTHFTTSDAYKELLAAPEGLMEWIILCISCICSGYLEESYFRFYLLSQREEFSMSAPAAVVVQAALFTICHLYEGPWGMANALLSGVLLALVFLRFKTLHGLAFAHGLYNITAYAAAALSAR